jgi:hypothetical protein
VRVLLDVNILVRANEKSQGPARLALAMRDEKDIVVLQTALAGEADVICTLDTDFYDPETRAFCSAAGAAGMHRSRTSEKTRYWVTAAA